MNPSFHISVAIPLLGEYENLYTLTDSLSRQTLHPDNFRVYFCVNNPDSWSTSTDESEHRLFLDNQRTIEFLEDFLSKNIINATVIDRSSPGHGWTGKQQGVGWARKVLFDTIAQKGSDEELIVSIDADTAFDCTYLQSLIDKWQAERRSGRKYSSLAVPYFHKLTGNEACDRAILRYEIYMRHYLLNLLMFNFQAGKPSDIHIPYAFTALGSAMVFPLSEYLRVGGITPLQGGEDFYLMQKFAKTGRVSLWVDEVVYPSSRASARVPFGTGPAVAKGLDYIESTYPLYPFEGFRAIAKTYSLFPQLYDNSVETPMSAFLCSQLKCDDPWIPLRKNFKTRQLFIHACQERVDGLRILQFLKTFPLRRAKEELQLFCTKNGLGFPHQFCFKTSPIADIDAVRNSLFKMEQDLRKTENTL